MPQCTELEDNTNRVLRVLECDSALWCNEKLGGNWVLNTTNKRVGSDWIYYPDTNEFSPPQPYSSWTLNTETYKWEPPTPSPTIGGPYTWLENQQEWVQKTLIQNMNSYGKLLITNENGSIQVGDSITNSNITGYHTKGEPTVMISTEACDFSQSLTDTYTYYSNITSVTQSNVYSNVTVAEYSNLIEDDQTNYLECSYYSSNSVGYYSNLMVYDGIDVFSNVTSNTYNAMTPEQQGGFTPILEYSNVYETDSPHHYIKVITHYSNLVVSNNVTYSNIDQYNYDNLIKIKPSYTEFRKYTFDNTGYFKISVQEYASLSLDQREGYTPVVVPESIVSNLQPYYTQQSTPVIRELKYIDASGNHVNQSNSVHIACQIKCTN
jgi:hypothetical protein